VDFFGGRPTGMRASEAKGPFPGGKRVGSRGKKKKAPHPSQWVGLRAMIRGLGVGGRKKSKSKRKKEKEKGLGRAPADLHPPLDKNRWASCH